MSNNRTECELPNKMASLDLVDSSSNDKDVSNDSDSEPARRSLRKRPMPVKAVANRRVIMKPKKIVPSNASEEDIKKLYSNANLKTVSQKLETIFEEPKAVNNTVLLIGGTKIKRSLKFRESSLNTKEKIKKRRSKIKRFLGNKNFANRKKVSMQAFLKTLQNLDADDAIEECTND